MFNLDTLNDDDRSIANILLSCGQEHLFDAFSNPNASEADRSRLLDQARKLNMSYPGGLEAYVKNSRELLKSSREGKNPFEGFTPVVPSGERLQAGTDAFKHAEHVGAQEFAFTGFVLVAGGLGERLGYNGIKIELPSETVTCQPFIGLYISYILAMQDHARRSKGDSTIELPLAIMTSGDTHKQTVALLEANNNFGMAPSQITIVKQEKVPALLDNDARFAVSSTDPFEIITKPHGHGDVHTLLHQHGLVKKWIAKGMKWLVFFQDTNGVVFRALPAAIGVSSERNFAMNSLTVPRKPGEAVGGICKLRKDDGSSMTINVEYNQLDPLLRATVSPEGDVPDSSGFSPYPGNINVLIFALEPYSKALESTGGAVPEFVNPKYADASKSSFKKPTRLECMMQDFPKLFGPDVAVGFTQLERWMSFSAVKNNLVDAKEKLEATGFAECASSGEADIFELNRRLLSLGANVEIEQCNEVKVFGELPVPLGAQVILSPDFGLTQEELSKNLSKSRVKISKTSTLVLNGRDIEIRDLELDGFMEISVSNGSSVVIDGLRIHNKGCELVPSSEEDPESIRIRGYRTIVPETDRYHFSDGKSHVLQ